jgi:threonine synthase
VTYPLGLECIRCGTEYEVGPLYKGCLACLERGLPTNLRVVVDGDQIRRTFDPGKLADRPTSMWRYSEFLPANREAAVSLGEGQTPLTHLPRLGKRLGLSQLYAKNETMNPTWSFKDRLASSAVSFAPSLGAGVITGSSSGNAGAATAAYAARAGLPCVMFTTQQFPQAMKVQMGVYGSKLVAVPTIFDRWRLVEAGVERFGWFPVTVFVWPLVGSNIYGIEGYKTIGYELVDQLGRVPEKVVMPVGAGDAFFGAWKGFQEYRKLGYADAVPTMLAGEVFAPLQNAQEKGLDHIEETKLGPTVAISVGLHMSTYQALSVLNESGGIARSANDAEMIAMQKALAEDEGIYAEASSVLSLAVIPHLIEAGAIDPDDTVVCLLTSSGLKHPEMTAENLMEIPLIEPELDALTQLLSETYDLEVSDSVLADAQGDRT